MEPALKQRLWGAVILVALAVIFLPMLIQGPAPDSGVSDVPLTMPDAPSGEYETRELPLVTPAEAPEGGAVGLDATHPDAADLANVAATPGAAEPAAATSSQPVPLGADGVSAPSALPAESAPAVASAPLPASSAGGDYAVNVGSFVSAANAEGLVRSLKQSQLPAYSEPATVSGRSGHRVRVGPYATRADAEAARLRAQQLRGDLRGSVVALDAKPLTTGAASPSVPRPVPVAQPAKTTATAPAASAAGTGFAVQLAAFSKAADANALRDRLRAAGFSAFVEQVNTDKGALSRVRVGPVVGRGEADQLKAQVKTKIGIDGIVRPHP